MDWWVWLAIFAAGVIAGGIVIGLVFRAAIQAAVMRGLGW